MGQIGYTLPDEGRIRWYGHLRTDCPCLQHSAKFSYAYITGFSGVGRPAVKGAVDKTARPIRAAVVNQSADNAQTPVGIAFLEEERIGREVPVKFDLARMMGILLTAFEALQTFPKRAVADAFGVLHYLIVVLLTHDFHKA